MIAQAAIEYVANGAGGCGFARPDPGACFKNLDHAAAGWWTTQALWMPLLKLSAQLVPGVPRALPIGLVLIAGMFFAIWRIKAIEKRNERIAIRKQRDIDVARDADVLETRHRVHDKR
jgi:hypothetical protein